MAALKALRLIALAGLLASAIVLALLVAACGTEPNDAEQIAFNSQYAREPNVLILPDGTFLRFPSFEVKVAGCSITLAIDGYDFVGQYVYLYVEPESAWEPAEIRACVGD